MYESYSMILPSGISWNEIAASIVPMAKQIRYKTSSVYQDLFTNGFIKIVTFDSNTNNIEPPCHGYT